MSKNRADGDKPETGTGSNSASMVTTQAAPDLAELVSDFHTLQAEQAFQGQTVQELHEALAMQQRDILEMQRQLALLAEQLRSLRENSGPGGAQGMEAADAKPPHY